MLPETGAITRQTRRGRARASHTLQSVACRGLWPAGEGAGYAGGIMSAATDGLRIASALCEWGA